MNFKLPMVTLSIFWIQMILTLGMFTWVECVWNISGYFICFYQLLVWDGEHQLSGLIKVHR